MINDELKSTISFCLNHPEPVLATHDRYIYMYIFIIIYMYIYMYSNIQIQRNSSTVMQRKDL
eukprot:COSAG06_NODE_9709_length_1837_cov_125.360184_2_plen_62_part_00